MNEDKTKYRGPAEIKQAREKIVEKYSNKDENGMSKIDRMFEES
jgi:hypothetical protein